MFKCDLADLRVEKNSRNDWCRYKESYCDDGNGCPDWFDEKLEEIEPKNVCKMSSIFGNYYISLTKKQIEGLLNGKVYGLTGEEYNFFIKMESDN